MRARQIEFAADGWPIEFVIAERFGWTLEQIARLPNRTVLDLLAYIRIGNEIARKPPAGR